MSQSLPPRKSPQNSEKHRASEEDNRDHYSLDDIMDSLRDSEKEKGEQGEIVTRSDGSKARKVRRRKRRSDQPESAKKKSTKEVKAAQKKKSLILKVTCSVGFLLALFLGGLFMMIRYNSENYASQVEEGVGEWTGSEVDFTGLKVLPGSISMNEARFDWGEGYFTKALTLKKVSGHAKVASFLGKKMGGQEIGGVKGVLELCIPPGGGSWIEGLAEEKFPYNFQRYYCDGLNVLFGESDFFQFQNTHASLRYLTGSGWKLHLDGGLLTIKGWEPFPVKLGLLDFHEGEVEISSLKLQRPESLDSLYNSNISVSGRIPLKIGEQAVLDIETKNFSLEGLFGKNLGKLFRGSIRAIEDSKLTFTVGSDGIDDIFMPFVGDHVTLRGFPFIRDLHELFPDKGFETIRLNHAIDGVFRYLPQGMGIKNLKMSDETQFLRFGKGNIFVSHDGNIKGRMQIFISRGLINGDPAVKALSGFVSSTNDKIGYSVIDVQLGGTVDLPQDNFREVVGMHVNGTGPNFDQDGGESFENLFEKLIEETD